MQSKEFLKRTGDEMFLAVVDGSSTCELASCNRVLTTQIGFVHVDVAIPSRIADYECDANLQKKSVALPAQAAAARWTSEFSSPPLNFWAIICFPFP